MKFWFAGFIFFSEHQELSKQIHDTVDSGVRDDLERELDVLVARMEAKGDQIAKLRRHKEMVGWLPAFMNY